MGLFKRSRPQPPPDGDLPLNVDQAARLRSLVRTAFAEAGTEVVVRADHVIDDDGRQFGLWNIAAVCNTEPERTWPGLVRAHVALLGRPDDIESMDAAELGPSVYLRLVETAGLPDRSWHPGAQTYGDDLTALLSVDRAEMVSTPREDYWDARGGLDRWLVTGRANLLALLISDDLDHERITPSSGAGGFEVVSGDSFFTASTALLTDDLLRRFVPAADASRGVLLAMPFRHQIAFRVIDGTADSAVALNHLFQFAMLGFSDAPGPLSPHVYWIRDGRWVQITRFDDSRPVVELGPDLAELLGITAEE